MFGHFLSVIYLFQTKICLLFQDNSIYLKNFNVLSSIFFSTRCQGTILLYLLLIVCTAENCLDFMLGKLYTELSPTGIIFTFMDALIWNLFLMWKTIVDIAEVQLDLHVGLPSSGTESFPDYVACLWILFWTDFNGRGCCSYSCSEFMFQKGLVPRGGLDFAFSEKRRGWER